MDTRLTTPLPGTARTCARKRASLTGTLLLLVGNLATNCAVAVPVQLTRAEFEEAIAGHAVLVDDFQTLPRNRYLTNPVALRNGAFTADTPLLTQSFCPDGQWCLIDAASISTPRTFRDFEPWVRYWGVETRTSPLETFEVTVRGGSGKAVFTGLNPHNFFGFYDSAGLQSVSIRDLGHGTSSVNYVFVNVLSAVPEPSTAALLAAGALALWWRSRRSR